MSKFKKCKVVMLPTNEKAIKGNIILNTPNIKLMIMENRKTWSNYDTIQVKDSSFYEWDKFMKPQHFYITSDDEIKENDWCISINKNSKLHKPFKSVNEKTFINPKFLNSKDCDDIKKIIATTDTKIISDYSTSGNTFVPEPSQAFIEKYIEEYNKGNIITEVLVEYEWNGGRSGDYDQLLKVNYKNNTITIKKVKDNWSKKEVVRLLRLILCDSPNMIETFPDGSVDTVYNEEFNKWIEENL